MLKSKKKIISCKLFYNFDFIVLINFIKKLIPEIDLLKPRECPFKLIRIGGNKDGAYLIPDDLLGIEACFSPGVSNSKDFEDHLASKYKIKSHMCDYSSDIAKFKTKIIKGFQTFEKKWLDIKNNENCINLDDWVEKYSPNSQDDLILQMDIEGAEYRNILNTKIKLIKRFRIIIIELHNVLNLFDESNAKNIKSLLKKLNETHICIHAHPNNCQNRVIVDVNNGMNIPNVIELSYLRKDRFKKKSKLIDVELPNPLDIESNVISRKPIHLNKNWLKTNRRSLKSIIKISFDYSLYYFYLFKQIIKKSSSKIKNLFFS